MATGKDLEGAAQAEMETMTPGSKFTLPGAPELWYPAELGEGAGAAGEAGLALTHLLPDVSEQNQNSLGRLESTNKGHLVQPQRRLK